MDEVYRLFDRRCRMDTALTKLAVLRRRLHRFKKLRKALKKLFSPNIEKSLAFLDDSLLPSTSNAVERANRRHRKMLYMEFDSRFRILSQPGRSIYELGTYTYAGGVAAIPGGSIFLKPSMDRELYRLVEGMARPQKWRAGIELFGPFIALPDGSIVLAGIQKRKTYRLAGCRQQEIGLFSGPYAYLSALAVGPEGNIWAYDAAQRRPGPQT